MASKAAVAEALAFLAGAVPNAVVTQRVARTYAEVLSEVSDGQVHTAARILARRVLRFLPSPGEMLKVAETVAMPPDVGGLAHELSEAFFQRGHYDRREWEDLADLCDRIDRPHRAAWCRQRIGICEQLIADGYLAGANLTSAEAAPVEAAARVRPTRHEEATREQSTVE